jgi:hypothetical protein
MFCAVSIGLIVLFASLGLIQCRESARKQIEVDLLTEQVETLRMANTALQAENEEYSNNVRLALETLESITFDEIVYNPGGVDLWLQTIRQTLEGE